MTEVETLMSWTTVMHKKGRRVSYSVDRQEIDATVYGAKSKTYLVGLTKYGISVGEQVFHKPIDMDMDLWLLAMEVALEAHDGS